MSLTPDERRDPSAHRRCDPGSWAIRAEPDGDEDGYATLAHTDEWSTPYHADEDVWFPAGTPANAKFITHARTDMTRLLDDLEAAESALFEVERRLRQTHGYSAEDVRRIALLHIDAYREGRARIACEHLPTLPDRETVIAALAGLTREQWDRDPGADLMREALRARFGGQADAMLALLSARSEAVVKAEALAPVRAAVGNLNRLDEYGDVALRHWIKKIDAAVRADTVKEGADHG